MTQSDSMGKRLARYRKEAGLSAQALADRIGVTRAVVNNLELGRREDMTVGQLVQIANALQVPVAALAADIQDPFGASRYGELRNWDVVELLNGSRFQSHDASESISHIAMLGNVVENWGQAASDYIEHAQAFAVSKDHRDWSIAQLERKALERMLERGRAAYTLLKAAGVNVTWAVGDWMHYEIPDYGLDEKPEGLRPW
ncbi:helix-turn-helix transcriptional regulator [Microbacterium sp.]|uniref:helix-turn-helix domain-containing protein n=1 Tax=Microbacterium sp. TaxID=51671 RepID=UPI0032423584